MSKQAFDFSFDGETFVGTLDDFCEKKPELVPKLLEAIPLAQEVEGVLYLHIEGYKKFSIVAQKSEDINGLKEAAETLKTQLHGS